MKRITFITGGARSGKSRFALSLAESARHKAFIATAEPTDDEMRDRINRHRAERGDDFLTIETPLDPASAIAALSSDIEVAVVDCLTVWLGNVMYRRGLEQDRFPEVDAFLSAIETSPVELVIVSNELGMGLVPSTPLGRRFRDLAGYVNQQVARIAHTVILMVSGIPVTLKGDRK